jgi:uncharacterized membrane protein
MAASIESLTVWRLPEPGGLDTALARLERGAAERRIVIEDAAAVSWPDGLRKPRTRELGSLTGPGTLWGGFWGVLLGLVFLTPLAGPAFGAAAGAIAGTLSDFGIGDDFVVRVRQTVTPGTSALFVVSDGDTADAIADALGDLDVALLRCDFSGDHHRRLHHALDEESERPIA